MLSITHYEEEVYSDWLEVNQCRKYTDLMKKFERDKYYMGVRQKEVSKIEKPPYIDPDVDCLKSCSYYWELTQFLNQQEERMGGEFRYVAPSGCKKDGVDEAELRDENERQQIAVYCSGASGRADLYLKSDQFGFSAGNLDKKYPYGMLYEKAKQKDDEKQKDRQYAFVADCIYDTRTLGGGFLWPLEMWAGYNRARGGSANSSYKRYYIEDRVDLTLLEVKHLFEWIFEDDGRKKDEIWDKYHDVIFRKKIREDSNKNSAYIKWFRHFGSFENYIKFLCFDDFMVDVMPIDIVESELRLSGDGMRTEGEKVPLEDPTKYKDRAQNSIYRLDEPEIVKMLNNVRCLITARSQRMQSVLEQRRKKPGKIKGFGSGGQIMLT